MFVDKSEKSIYLADIGVGIYISKFQPVLSTNFHRHVWENINSVGYSGVFMYLNSFLDIVLAKLDDIKDKNTKGELYYSFGKLKACALSENERMIVSKVEMGNSQIKSTVQHFPTIFKHINSPEIVPQAQRNGSKF